MSVRGKETQVNNVYVTSERWRPVVYRWFDKRKRKVVSRLMLVMETTAANELLRAEIERIVRSEEFRNSEVLRRLLLYLADRAVAGEADNLKEYIVAIEGLGKPSSYDPQHNSAVRIQVGRLRQKLAEYYRNEGKNDPLIVHLPKGRFRLVCEDREEAAAVVSGLPEPLEAESTLVVQAPERVFPWSMAAGVLAFALIAAIAFGVWAFSRSTQQTVVAQGWSPELDLLWAPFTGATTKKPLIILIEDPLFVELHSNPGVYYRDRSLNQWGDVQHSQSMEQVAKALHSPAIQPSRYYTAFGEVDAAFRLGRFLGPHTAMFSLGKASQVTWQQMADNAVIFIGVENLFFEQTKRLPAQPQLQPVLEGVKNLHPLAGEPMIFEDQYQTAPTEQGMIYAVVTHAPGPLGINDVESFTSNRSAGYVGAVQAFSDPAFARIVVERLKASCGGRMPRYYQVLLQVHFTDDVPTDTNYVLGRELR